MNNIEIFNKVRSNLTLLVEKNKGLVINGPDDKEGYKKMKEAKNEVRKGEIELERLAKSEREGALNWQREIIRLEKELKEQITSELIQDYTRQLDEIDMLIARKEREVLLPIRKKQLEEIEMIMSDEQILDLDEKQWSEMYQTNNYNYLRNKEEERKEKERKENEEKIRVENEKIKQENEILKKQQEEKDALIKRQNDEREAIKAKQEQEERERLAKIKAEEEAKRQLELGPDKDKLIKLSKDVLLVEFPEVKDEKAKQILENAKDLLVKVSKYIVDNSNNL